MANIYNFSRHALLKRIGLTPGKKMLIFFISAAILTIPLSYVYNSVTLILFVLYTFLSYSKQNIKLRLPLLPLLLLFLLMVLSLVWSVDFNSTLKALSREAPLLFIPIAFCFNQPLSRKAVTKILENYSLGIILFGIILLGRAVMRYSDTGSIDVFFYHELATNDVNAIYLSVLVSMALMYFLCKKRKTFWGYSVLLFLLVFLFLLSSKVIIITNVLLIAIYYIFYSGMKVRGRVVAILLLCIMAGGLGYYGKINERIAAEFTNNKQQDEAAGGVHYVTLKEAWSRNDFNGNDYLNGTSFRLYQIRIFTEMLKEDPVLFTGYGLNASCNKVEEQGIEHNLIHGDKDGMVYNKLNFHNQYVQTFADLGIFGFLIVIVMLFINLKNGLTKKDFIHIAFAIVMISLFLTESFLWRQRGVVFFTMFYCIFNTALLPGTSDKKKI
ncbi:hypothetical protein DVK85_05395 [Flavobacterium arcticum]|uniref:O-antigen ligase-related domain-containing protein n=1 Tax=Flavobacterium arcticum TaxID=1784713 RepID=A0A345HAT5_9FLAO|nr:O-antigen ligase family protein [Flavobacterium arcticum]AXG73695.1 hypothetical protein DVK85_05395 [Flavobacterium arcticum]KAF2511646.1 hypothetical protein E0W72_04905 [Flavobacterium arcticum]